MPVKVSHILSIATLAVTCTACNQSPSQHTTSLDAADSTTLSPTAQQAHVISRQIDQLMLGEKVDTIAFKASIRDLASQIKRIAEQNNVREALDFVTVVDEYLQTHIEKINEFSPDAQQIGEQIHHMRQALQKAIELGDTHLGKARTDSLLRKLNHPEIKQKAGDALRKITDIIDHKSVEEP